MNASDLTDEAFREARRQIVGQLQAGASAATESAANWTRADCDNPQNARSRQADHEVERARGYGNAAAAVAGMEREGFNWGAAGPCDEGGP